jgi:hypothetical protein
MSTLTFKPLSGLFNVATMLLCNAVWPQGFDTSETDAPSSLKALKAEFATRGRITVFGGSSDRTIFDSAEVNHAFRAWHDWAHLALDAPFNLDGETAACDLQARQLVTVYGDGDTGRELVAILRAEVIGQALYWAKWRTYVADQRAFAAAYMRNPESALACRF